MVFEVVDFPIDDRIGGISGQQLLKRVDHAMLRGVAELVEKGLDPSRGQFGAIWVKVAGETPEVLAAVIEVQGFGRLGEAVLDQVPNPEGSIGHDENFFGSSQAHAHRLGLDPSPEIDEIGIGRNRDNFFSISMPRPEAFAARSSSR